MSTNEELFAIEEIKQLKARYFRCLDTKDWAGYLAVFTPDATVDSSWAYTPIDYAGKRLTIDGAFPDPVSQWITQGAAKFVAETSKFLENAVTVHHGHMPEIKLTSPTTASGIWAMEDKIRWPKGSHFNIPIHDRPAREMHGYGHYTETYERLPDGWRIKSLKLTRVRVDVIE